MPFPNFLPESDDGVCVMDDPIAQGVETGSEAGLSRVSVRPLSASLTPRKFPRTGIGKDHGQRDDGQQRGQLFRVCHGRVLEVHAPALAVGKQALDEPPPLVDIHCLQRLVAVGDDEQHLAVFEPLAGEAQRMAKAFRHGGKARWQGAQPCPCVAIAGEGLQHADCAADEPDICLPLHAD